MNEKARIAIEFTVGISRAYPTLLDFLQNYLPRVCAIRENYNMKDLARDMDLSPSQISQKLSGANNTAFSTKDLDSLKRVLSGDEYRPIIAYQIEKTLGSYNDKNSLLKELKEIASGN